jgi:hypothetical protein
VPPVRGLWRLRAVRQITLGLVPLLAVGLAILIALLVRAHTVSDRLAPATARASGVVVSVGPGNPRPATVRWTDSRGTRQVGRVTFPGSVSVPRGTRVSLHYVPDDPHRVYADGDTNYTLLGVLLGESVLVVVVLAVALGVTAVRVTRRVLLARQPATTLPVSRVHTKVGLIQRSWLVIERNRRESWVPVFWEPVLGDLMTGTPAAIHGNPDRGGVVVDIAGTLIWPSGWRRASPPRGEHRSNAGRWSQGAERRRAGDPEWTGTAPVSMARQARGDVALLLAAPIMGLLWSYIDGLGSVGFGLSTALFAALLFWVPTVYGSDPS